MRILFVAAVLAIMICTALAVRGYAQSDFYKGKTITVVQIVEAGGTGDLRRKALFPFLQKYIPGNPTIVSDYMPGGGGRKAANHVYRVAKPDGLTIGGMSSSLVSNAILDTGGVFRIGCGDLTVVGGETWNGEIDEVRIWPFARSAAAIQSTMNMSLAAMPGELSTWNLDGTFVDSSGLNHGTGVPVTARALPWAVVCPRQFS